MFTTEVPFSLQGLPGHPSLVSFTPGSSSKGNLATCSSLPSLPSGTFSMDLPHTTTYCFLTRLPRLYFYLIQPTQEMGLLRLHSATTRKEYLEKVQITCLLQQTAPNADTMPWLTITTSVLQYTPHHSDSQCHLLMYKSHTPNPINCSFITIPLYLPTHFSTLWLHIYLLHNEQTFSGCKLFLFPPLMTSGTHWNWLSLDDSIFLSFPFSVGYSWVVD